ncbi:MAG: phosphatase PAP2 family protein [Opitutaceae bacterium]|jgi:hypothetical protein|nr:phosphatase PAP2 family protein [Opitutaceae bacterium]
MKTPPRLIRQLCADKRAKLLIGLCLMTLCCAIYIGLQHIQLRPPLVRTPCPVSALLPFDPRWTLPYLSMFILIVIAWQLAPDRRELIHLGKILLGTEMLAWLFFLFFPTLCPRPPAPDAPAAYRLLIFVDAPLNCFPCLHAALTLIAATSLRRHLSWLPATLHLVTGAIITLWSGVILVSILILRQHTALDIAAGLAIATATLAIGKK